MKWPKPTNSDGKIEGIAQLKYVPDLRHKGGYQIDRAINRLLSSEVTLLTTIFYDSAPRLLEMNFTGFSMLFLA